MLFDSPSESARRRAVAGAAPRALPAVVAWLLAGVAGVAPLCGQAPSDAVTQVGMDQRLNAEVPGGLTFRDHTGETVRLYHYLGGRPIVLCLVYFECPMLCTLELNGLVRSLKAMSLEVGRDLTVLVVSFDPRETPELAAKKRRVYIGQYGRPESAAGWHFLTGDETNTAALCRSVGFRYVYDPERGEYAHASGIVLLTPQGKIARYFYGIDYPAKDLRLGLVEASSGRVGTATDRLLLLCYGYDPATGKYGFLVMNAIRLGGLLTVLLLGAFIVVTLSREHGRRRRPAGRAADRVASSAAPGGPPARRQEEP